VPLTVAGEPVTLEIGGDQAKRIQTY
jgi:hypothetical protein